MACDWLCLGAIENGADGLKFPFDSSRRLDVPGIYRLKICINGKEYVYIGKSGNLLRRPLYDYRRPASGVEIENVIHRMLRDATCATVEIMPILVGSITEAEKEAQERAFEQNELLLNVVRGKGPGLGYARFLEYRIKYYKRLLEQAEVDYARL